MNEELSQTWTLITVTGAGQVNHSRGYETLFMCEQAKSLALTGMTIEQNKAADEAHAKARADWEDAHPWREPREQWERDFAKSGSSASCSNGYSTWHFSDGKIREGYPSDGMSASYSENKGEWCEWVRGTAIIKRRHDVKHAECIREPKP